MDGRRRQWLAVDAYYYDSNLAVAIRADCGIIGLTVFDAFLRACKSSPVEGQVAYGSTEGFLATIGLPCAQLVDEAGDNWDLDRLWTVTSRHKQTKVRRQSRLTYVTSTRWARWQRSRSSQLNTDTIRRESKRVVQPDKDKDNYINPPTPLDCSPVLAEQEERLELEAVRAQRLAIVPAAKRQAKETG